MIGKQRIGRHRLVHLTFFFVAICLGVTYAPVIAWYVARTNDSSDEPWGVLALCMFAVYFIRDILQNRRIADCSEKAIANISMLLGTSILGLVYGLTYHVSPPLLHAVFFVACLALMTNRILPAHISRIGYFQLLFLSLPLLPSLEFYCGYPFRALNAAVLAYCFRIMGCPVMAAGATLRYESVKIFIDAPCSGIKMCWTTWFFLACVVCGLRLTREQTLRLCAICGPLLFFANLARTAFLFSLEVFTPQYPKSLHEGMGLICFLWIAIIILLVGSALKKQSLFEVPKNFTRVYRPLRFELLSQVSSMIVCVLVHAYAYSVIQKAPPIAGVSIQTADIQWPQEFLGRKLEEMPLTGREEIFLRDFPGAVRRFRSPTEEVVVRAVLTATRKLHPVADCLKGQGYTVEPAPAYQAKEYGLMNCSFARDENAQFHVCEIIFDNHGKSWTDVSEWYWSAVLGHSSGPWYAISISDKKQLTL